MRIDLLIAGIGLALCVQRATNGQAGRPTPLPAGVVGVDIETSQFVWDGTRQRILAAFSTGNNSSQYLVAAIDPQNGKIDQAFPIGEEPRQLAVSDDGVYLYAASSARPVVRRFKLSDHSLDLEIGLGPGSTPGAFSILPGQRESIVVATPNGLMVYDNTMPRPEIVKGLKLQKLLFRRQGELLGFTGKDFVTAAVDRSGVRVIQTINAFALDGGRVSIGERFAVNAAGYVFDLTRNRLSGRLGVQSDRWRTEPLAPPGDAIFAVVQPPSGESHLVQFSPDRLVPLASLPIGPARTTAGLTWKEGLAFNVGRRLLMIKTTTAMEAGPPVPGPTRDPDGTLRLPLPSNDAVYDRNRRTIWAAVPGYAGSFGNSIVPLNPEDGTPGNPLFVGSEPENLRLSGAHLSFHLAGTDQNGSLDLGTGRVDALSSASNAVPSTTPATPPSRVQGASSARTGTAILPVINGGPATVSPNSRFATVDDGGWSFTGDGWIWTEDQKTRIGHVDAEGIPLPDRAHGRVFYANRSGCTTEFSLSTLVKVSSACVKLRPSPDSSVSVVRAFLTGDGVLALSTGYELIFLRTTALKSNEPAKVSPQEPSAGVLKVSVPVTGLAATPAGRLFAVTPGRAGANGNSFISIDPYTGAIEKLVDVGSEPKFLAVSRNGGAFYTWLSAEGQIGRVSLGSTKRDLVFAPTGLSAPSTPQRQPGLFVTDLAVDPVSGTLAVSYQNRYQSSQKEIALFDNGVQRRQTAAAAADKVLFGDSGKSLYGITNAIARIEMRTEGLHLTSTSAALDTSPGILTARARYADGLLYSPLEDAIDVIDPERARRVGQFTAPRRSEDGSSRGQRSMLVMVDSEAGRVYYLGVNDLLVFDKKTFALIGKKQLPAFTEPSKVADLIKVDADTLAMHTDQNVYLVRISSIPLLPQPIPSAQPDQTQTAAPGIRNLEIAANDIVFDRSRNLLYAGTPAAEGNLGNRVISIALTEPATARTLIAIKDAGRLILSDDAAYLYVVTSKAIERVNLAKGDTLQITDPTLPDLSRLNGSTTITDIAVVPGKPRSFAVATGNDVRLYEDAQMKARITTIRCNYLAFASSETLYCRESGSRAPLLRLKVTSNSLSLVRSSDRELLGDSTNLRFAAGKLYLQNGRVIEAETLSEKGRVAGQGLVAVDDSRAYWLGRTDSAKKATIRSFDRESLEPASSREVQGPDSFSPRAFIPCGNRQLCMAWGRSILVVNPQ